MSVSFADRETRLEDVRAEIDDAVQGLANPAAWKAFLDTAAQFPRYSFNNNLLVQLQCPGATRVQGAGNKAKTTGWAKLGRYPSKGSKAIWIFAPCTYKREIENEKTGETTTVSQLRGFKLVPVFDVSQTDGTPLPEIPVRYEPVTGDVDPAIVTELIAKIADHGFQVEFTELAGSADGNTDFISKVVHIDAQSSSANQALTLAHELAHIALDHGSRISEYHTGANGSRSSMEIEAESVAYVLARRLGIPTESSSFSYIAGWAHGETDKVKATATAVLKACKALLPEDATPATQAA